MYRERLYRHLRLRSTQSFGTSLSSAQVAGIEAILDAGSHLPLPHLAHVLGEVHHETGGYMSPIKETVFPSHRDKNPSDDLVKARLTAAWKKGVMPWVSSDYWSSGYFGRGQIQLTHRTNYQKMSAVVGLNLVTQPHLALQLAISSKVAVIGCERGMFTGKKLADFDAATPAGALFNHNQARRIVNGYVSKQARDVEMAAKDFEEGLREAGYVPSRAISSRPSPPGAAAPVAVPPTTAPASIGFIAWLLKLLRGDWK